MFLTSALKKLGWLSLVFFSLSLNAQPTHKIISSFGVQFNLPTSWRLFTQEELAATELSNPSLEAGTTELIINTASIKPATPLSESTGWLDNLVLSLSHYQLPTKPRQVNNACQTLLPKLLAEDQQPIKLSRCQASKIQGMPTLILSYSPANQSQMQVLQYLIQLKPNQSLNATLTFQTENSSSAAAFEAAMMKLKVLP